MAEVLKPNLCVLGAGSAGLAVAAVGAQMGADTVLIERGKMGGDCLNYGCVPSKSLLVAGKAAAAGAQAADLGVRYAKPEVDFAAVHDHVHRVIAAIAPNDSVERFEGLGVRVIRESARFTGPDEVQAGDVTIRARRFVLATGSSALVPPIDGLDDVPYLTNETVFDLTERPEHLIVVGGGPIGCELGQAFRLLGAKVSILEADSILPKDDPELVDILRTRLRADGVDLFEGARVVSVARAEAGVAVTIEEGGEEKGEEGGAQGKAERTVTGSHLLLAVGRRASIDGLGLEAAGIDFDEKGLKVDDRLRTSNQRVFAAGDVTGGLQFTHMAGYHAGIVLRNALFYWPAKVDRSAVPWVTYTEPELAHVGLNEDQARERHGEIRILRWPFHENDRAQTERRTDGLVKAITTKRGKVLGASVVGAHAGEVIQPWILAIAEGLKIGALAQMIAPYPTMGEANKRSAGSFYTPQLFSERTKRIVRLLAYLG